MGAQEPMNGSESLNTFIPLLETKKIDAASTHRGQNGKNSISTEIQLPRELEKELARITSEFTVDTPKLKDIVKQFGEELDEGLKKTHQNIVC